MLSDAEDSTDSEASSEMSTRGKRRWEWRFCLLVEDGGQGFAQSRTRERIKLFVTDADAVFLLSMDATK